MKKLFLTAMAVIFCVLVSSAQATSKDNSQAKNKANTLKVDRAIETGDVSKLDAFIDKNIVDHAGENGDIIGLDAVKNMFLQMHNHISNIKIESIANATDGDYHFNLARMTGTTNSEYMGMPANTPIDMTNVNVVRIKNGKAVEHWRYSDPKDIMKMMHMRMMNKGMDHNMADSAHKMNNGMDSSKMR